MFSYRRVAREGAVDCRERAAVKVKNHAALMVVETVANKDTREIVSPDNNAPVQQHRRRSAGCGSRNTNVTAQASRTSTLGVA